MFLSFHPMNERSIERSTDRRHPTVVARHARDVDPDAMARRPFDGWCIGCKGPVEPASIGPGQAIAMPTRERPVDRATLTARADIARLGSDLRTARVGAGLSLRRVAEAVGIAAPQISRIERGLAPSTSVVQLARLGAVIGLDVRLRAYPGGDALRDTGQLRVIDRFRERLPPRVSVRLEVPLPIPRDRRAWDMFLDHLLDEHGHREDYRSRWRRASGTSRRSFDAARSSCGTRSWMQCSSW